MQTASFQKFLQKVLRLKKSYSKLTSIGWLFCSFRTAVGYKRGSLGTIYSKDILYEYLWILRMRLNITSGISRSLHFNFSVYIRFRICYKNLAQIVFSDQVTFSGFSSCSCKHGKLSVINLKLETCPCYAMMPMSIQFQVGNR